MERRFYTDAADYWERVPATMNGVLGGFDFISDVDVKGSRRFLEELSLKPPKGVRPPGVELALDCGAGIGRVSKYLLTHYFKKVDLVEQNAKFLEEAKRFVGDEDRLGDLYPVGLQDFVSVKKYDVIWCQWVLGHLTDDDLVNFFVSCRDSLAENGLIIVKENFTSSNKVEKDDTDSSITRPLSLMLTIFKRAKLKIIKEYKQNDFPKGIYPVYMFALRRRKTSSDKDELGISHKDPKVEEIKEEQYTIDRLQNIKIEDEGS